MPGSAARALGQIVRRLGRGYWTRYTVFAGTNDRHDLALALRALAGLTPLVDGPAIRQYEESFARRVGVQHAVSFAAGRMAFYALLEALDIGPGDEVIVPAFTCVVVPNAIMYRGATPTYVDADVRTFNIDPAAITSRITSRTRAIVAQHTFGRPCDMQQVRAIAERHALPIVEDCAHALGATVDGRPVGSLGAGAFFSTDHTKMISTGAGGMAVTDDDRLADRLRRIQQDSPFLPAWRVRRLLAALAVEVLTLHPRVCVVGRYVQGALWAAGLRKGFLADEQHTARPSQYPARLSNAQAAIGLRQLDVLDANLRTRRALASLYARALPADTPGEEGESEHSYLRYTFLVDRREAWERHFDDVLDMHVWYTSPVHGRSSDSLRDVGYEPGSCPSAEWLARHCVNLPTHPRIRQPAPLVRALRAAVASPSPDLTRLDVERRLERIPPT